MKPVGDERLITPAAVRAAASGAAPIAADPVRLNPCKRYVWRSLPLAQRTGSHIFERLFRPQLAAPQQIATLLESPYPLPPDSLPARATAMARYSICAGPPRVADGQAQLWTPGIGEVLPLLRQMSQSIARGPAAKHFSESGAELTLDEDLPFTGGWLGWFGYDLAWEIERLPWYRDDRLPFPVGFWYEPAEFAVLDHGQQRLWLAAESAARLTDMTARAGGDRPGADPARPTHFTSSHSPEENIAGPAAALYRGDLYRGDSAAGDSAAAFARGADATSRSWTTRGLTFETAQTDFEAAVRQAKAYIRAGEVFQVNHSLRFRAETAMPSWAVYKALHAINPSPFASYWQTPWGSVVSCSPERLVNLNAGWAQSRPIAGTRPRGQSASEDEAIARELRGDRKERAEHIMLVDLERNDLGRVCQWGSVQVAELMAVERYSHVMHLVSNVEGQLQPGKSAAQLVAAMFPGGTITGCPKVRCMEIIEELEPVRRSLFYGSCGYLDRRGRLDLNILIRTLLMAEAAEGWQVWGQVGAGIVADSEPEREWQESLQKARAQLLALGL